MTLLRTMSRLIAALILVSPASATVSRLASFILLPKTPTVNSMTLKKKPRQKPSRLLASVSKEQGKPKTPQFQQPRYSPQKPEETSALDKAKTRTRKFGGDSRLASRHKERLQMAGREGTKRYQNPNKVFLGNLAFDLTSKDLEAWLSEQFSVPAPLLLKQCKVIQDWKTQKSKGYGFAVFTEPVYATVCLEKCNNQELRGRRLNVSPGYKKQIDPAVYLEQKRQKAKDREEAAIQAGIDLAELNAPPPKPKLDPIEAQLLRQLDPDLVDEEDVAVFKFKNEEMTEDDLLKDDALFSSDFDDDNDGVDGFWVEEDDSEDVEDATTPMNRERRREATRKRKKKKPSNKGFG